MRVTVGDDAAVNIQPGQGRQVGFLQMEDKILDVGDFSERGRVTAGDVEHPIVPGPSQRRMRSVGERQRHRAACGSSHAAGIPVSRLASRADGISAPRRVAVPGTPSTAPARGRRWRPSAVPHVPVRRPRRCCAGPPDADAGGEGPPGHGKQILLDVIHGHTGQFGQISGAETTTCGSD